MVSGASERVEALHPGHEVSPTAVVSSSVLDALEFYLTVEDSTESECGELEGSELPVVPSVGDRTSGRRVGRFRERISTVGVGGHSL